MYDLKIQIDNREFCVDSNHKGDLTITLSANKEVMQTMLASIYEHISTEDFIYTLDSDQVSEIVNSVEAEIILESMDIEEIGKWYMSKGSM